MSHVTRTPERHSSGCGFTMTSYKLLLSVRSRCIVGILVLCGLLVLVSGDSTENWRCPKLMFDAGVHYGCLNCSLCSNNGKTDVYNIRKECKEKNPAPIHDGSFVWCRNMRGPFPTCPPLPAWIQCSHNPLKSAPGASCLIRCGDVNKTVTCSQDVIWSPNPSSCPHPTDTVHGKISGTTRKPGANDYSTSSDMNSDITVPVKIVIGVGGFVFLVFCAFVCYHVYKRCRRPDSKSDSKTSSDTSLSVRGEAEDLIQNMCSAAIPKIKAATPGCLKETLQNQNVLYIGEDISEERTALIQTSHTWEGLSHEDSWKALKAFTDSKQEAEKFCQMFDQDDRFDRTTYHTIAEGMLHMSADEIHSLSFFKPGPEPSLSERPTYVVLKRLEQNDHGLLDLKNFLENQKHKKWKALELIDMFLDKWEQERKSSAV